MSYIDSDALTLKATLPDFNEWGGPVTNSTSDPELWESGVIQVNPNLDQEQSYWLNFFTNKREWFSLLVLNAAGKTVMQKEKRSREGHNLVSLDTSLLPLGTYKLRILTDGRILSGILNIAS